MNPGWAYLTLERTRMNTWTRKRRMKFRKRWRKQHGFSFRWYAATWKFSTQLTIPNLEETYLFHVREDT